MRWRLDSVPRRSRRRLPAAFSLLLSHLMAAGGGAAFAAGTVPAVVGGTLAGLAAPLGSPRPSARTSGVVAGQWLRVDLPATGSYFQLYAPQGWDGSTALPLVVFLHGSGSAPEAYENFLFPAADAVGCLVAAPKSASPQGWGTGDDEQTVAATVTAAAGLAPVVPAKVSIAGHSAGGAYAYLLAYGTVSRYSAVFSMSAPFYSVSAVADLAYKAPIHMYYGTTDPNYTGGGYAALVQQWNGLGVAWESDVETGYGHNVWPVGSMLAGFQFLAGKTYGATCAADATHLCLQQSRFRVEVAWQDGSGRTGSGSVVAPAVSADSGVLWFFDPANWEMLVKVLDGCGLNRRIWVFAAATTNVAYTLTVTDTVTGKVKSYQNPGGQTATPITDTGAFDACP